LLIMLLAAGCGKEDSRQHRTSVAPSGGAAPSAAVAAHSPSLATATCDSVARVRCYRDTARMRDLDYEPGEELSADWIVFVGAGDSISIRATSVGEVAQAAVIRLRQGRDSTVRDDLVAPTSGAVSVWALWMDATKSRLSRIQRT
jgi:hypothetical protein